MTTILFISGDHHTNSKFGLCPPRFTLDEGGDYKATPDQRKLWRAWGECLEWVQGIKDRHPDAKLMTWFNGDVTDGTDHHGTTTTITRHKSNALDLAVKALEPAVAMSDAVYFVAGTPSHVGEGHWMEERIAKDLGGVPFNDGAYTWPTIQMKIEGVTVWAAHHGRMGQLPHTKRNAANKTAATTRANCDHRGIVAPDLIFRSHMHQWADSYDNYRTRAIHLPCWQLPTHFVRRLDADALPEIGAVCVVITGRQYEVYKFEGEWKAPQPVRPQWSQDE